MQTDSRRIEHLDGLRGVAAMLVVLCHYFGAFLPLVNSAYGLPFWLNKLPSVLLNGRYAVLIFFVLSGFVLAQSSARTQSGLPSTLLARYLRLTVPMLLSLILAWFWVTQFSATRIEFQAMAKNRWLIDAFYTSEKPPLLRAVRDGIYGVYLTGYSAFNGPVWTMRKELSGSIAVYILYLLCPARFRWPGLALFAVITLGGPIYLGFPIGVLLRELWTRGWLKENFLSWPALAVSLALSWAGQLFSSYLNDCLLAIAAGLLVFSVITLPFLCWLLSRSVPQFLGRISFALYLVHLPLVLSVMAWGYLHLSWPLGVKFAVGLAVFVALASSLGWLLTVLVDEPLVRMLHRLKKIRWLRRSS